MTKEEQRLFNFTIEPKTEKLIPIYEHFLDVCTPKNKAGIEDATDLVYEPTHLKKMPPAKWYPKMETLINEYGYENYRNHVVEILEAFLKMIRVQKRYMAIIKVENKKPRTYVSFSDYIPRAYEVLPNSPMHYYFNCSARGRYFKGMILSVVFIPDPIVLKLLLDFTLRFPFQLSIDGVTGLYTYEALEVFSKLDIKKSIPFILAVKYKKKAKWAQMRIDKYLNAIAEKHSLSQEEIIEVGLPDFELNGEKIFERTVHGFSVKASFENIFKKKVLWVNQLTGASQKSIPKILKEEHPESIKYIKDQIKEIETQIKIQAKRIEGYFFTNKKWQTKDWKEKFYDNHFMKLLSSNLIWSGQVDSETELFSFKEASFENLNGALIDLNKYNQISLWHPVVSSPEIIDSINERIQLEKWSPPFKQVDRECFGPNSIDSMLAIRMDKAIISQLLKSRGWSTASPYKLKLEAIHLKVEMITEDANDGTRGFYSGSANTCLTELKYFEKEVPVEASQLDPIVLSEILRDVNMFVMVGNKNLDEHAS